MLDDLAKYTELDGIVTDAIEVRIPKALTEGKWEKAIAYALQGLLAQRERDGLSRKIGDV